jgi:hypothetical protein
MVLFLFFAPWTTITFVLSGFSELDRLLIPITFVHQDEAVHAIVREAENAENCKLLDWICSSSSLRMLDWNALMLGCKASCKFAMMCDGLPCGFVGVHLSTCCSLLREKVHTLTQKIPFLINDTMDSQSRSAQQQ